MMRRLPLLFLLVVVTACANAPLSPLVNEERLILALPEDTRSVTVHEGMVFLDGPSEALATRGIRFPSGTYALEGEDAENLYFRAPEELEYRVFANGPVNNGRFIPGGLAISKAGFDLTPAYGYMSVDETNKVLTWKLGAEFLRAEGSGWQKNF